MQTQILSAITDNTDFKVNTATGEAFISQRKTAELLGVSKSAISSWISRAVKADTSQGLTADLFAECGQYFALDSSVAASEAK